MKILKLGPVVAVVCVVSLMPGCARHQSRPMITAVGLSPANQCDPPGIPYYLPKPLLVVAKNIRHIDESKVGLTGPAPIPNGFDNQAAYADIKANVTVPNTGGEAEASLRAANVNPAALSNAAPGQPTDQSIVPSKMTPDQQYKDGLTPDSFFTYQVIFVPDLTQKYGLQISGGAGEFRAAMNMVNGWMYTGMGPFYFKDSSSAQNAMATGVGAMYAGRGVSDVVDSVGGLTTAIGNLPQRESGIRTDGSEAQQFSDAVRALELAYRMAPKVHRDILNYAEVYIYEPVLLPDCQSTEWRLVAEHHFDRHYFDTAETPGIAASREQVMQGLLRQAMGGMELNQPAPFDLSTNETEATPAPIVQRLPPPSQTIDVFDPSKNTDKQNQSPATIDDDAKAGENAVRTLAQQNQQREAAIRQRALQLQQKETEIREQQAVLSEREAEVRIRENGQNFAMSAFDRFGGFQSSPQASQTDRRVSIDATNQPAPPSVVQMNVQDVDAGSGTAARHFNFRGLLGCEPAERPTVRREVSPQRIVLP